MLGLFFDFSNEIVPMNDRLLVTHTFWMFKAEKSIVYGIKDFIIISNAEIYGALDGENADKVKHLLFE